MADEHPQNCRHESSTKKDDARDDAGRHEKDQDGSDHVEGRDRAPFHPDRDPDGPWLGGG